MTTKLDSTDAKQGKVTGTAWRVLVPSVMLACLALGAILTGFLTA